MKYLLYVIWIATIFLGAMFYSCIPETFRYIYAFAIGAFSEAVLIYAKEQ